MNLSSLLDEILLEITAYLRDIDLQSFAQTAKSTCNPPQQALHQHVDPGSGCNCRLVQIVRTLGRQPGLAGHARSLKVSSLLLRGNHILPPMNGLTQIINLLPPDLRNRDRIRSVLSEKRSKTWVDCIFYLAPHLLHRLEAAGEPPPVYLDRFLLQHAHIEYVAMPASHVTAEWFHLRHLTMLSLAPTFNYPDIHSSEPSLPLGSLRLICAPSLLCPKP